MHKLFQSLLLLICSLIAAAGIAEIILRVIGFSYHPSFYKYDYELGTVLQPNAQGWWRSEGAAYVRINASGQRDDVEHPLTKPKKVLRIAILGDSYAEGFQLPVEQLFWKVLENSLADCMSRPVEVLNFGVSGYGTARELLMLRHRVKPYNPDIVLLAFLTGNDLRDNNRDLNQIDYIPYFELREGKLHLDTSFRDNVKFQRSQSQIHQAIRQLVYKLRLTSLLRQSLDKLRASNVVVKKSQPNTEPGLDELVYIPPQSGVWREAWAVTEALISEVSNEAREMGAHFYLVTLSNGIQVHPDKNIRAEYMHRLGIEDIFYPDMRIRNYANANGIDVLTLAPLLRDYAENNKVYLHGFQNTGYGHGHWNAEGHRVSGEYIADRLCKTLQ